jgi:anion-transporting  ArsA/GET3 family ATPase
MKEVVLVSGGKGGVGKSTAAKASKPAKSEPVHVTDELALQ